MTFPKHFRVSEIFGPTIQGEGRRIGTPCYFIRMAGCDYRCTWCDSPHAVLPNLVNQVPRISENQIYLQLRKLPHGPKWVVISGGNPALFDLEVLSSMLVGDGYNLMVETQGTVYNSWLRRVEDLCISPKPPSSLNMTSVGVVREFLAKYYQELLGFPNRAYLKVVVFDMEDYKYARDIHKAFPDIQMFLSVGNDDPSLPTVGNPIPDLEKRKVLGELEFTREVVLERMRWLMETVSVDPSMSSVRVTPQMHVLAWGNERGR